MVHKQILMKNNKIFRGLVGLSIIISIIVILNIIGYFTLKYMPWVYEGSVGYYNIVYGIIFISYIAIIGAFISALIFVVYHVILLSWDFLIFIGNKVLGYKEPIIDVDKVNAIVELERQEELPELPEY